MTSSENDAPADLAPVVSSGAVESESANATKVADGADCPGPTSAVDVCDDNPEDDASQLTAETEGGDDSHSEAAAPPATTAAAAACATERRSRRRSLSNFASDELSLSSSDLSQCGGARPKRKLKAIARFDPVGNARTNITAGEGFSCPRCGHVCSRDSRRCDGCDLECYYEGECFACSGVEFQ